MKCTQSCVFVFILIQWEQADFLNFDKQFVDEYNSEVFFGTSPIRSKKFIPITTYNAFIQMGCDNGVKSFPDLYNCRFYYNCEYDQFYPIRKQCVDNTHYNPASFTCQEGIPNDCTTPKTLPTTTNPPAETTTSTIYTTTTSPKIGCFKGSKSYPAIDDCRYFYNCLFSEPKRILCPNNTHYDPASYTCQDGIPEDCTKQKCGEEISFYPDPVSCLYYYACELNNSDPIRTQCPDKTHFNRKLGICETGSMYDDCFGPPTTTVGPPTFKIGCLYGVKSFLAIDNQQYYYDCTFADPKRVKCPPNLPYFNYNTLTCEEKEVMLPKHLEGVVYHPDVYDCRYYHAYINPDKNGNIPLVICPNGEYYSLIYGICVYMPSPPENCVLLDTRFSKNLNCGYRNTVYPDVTDCTYYYDCVYFDNPKRTKCPNNTYFDWNSHSCIVGMMPSNCYTLRYLGSGLFPDPKNCFYYYYAQSDTSPIITKLQCPIGYIFDKLLMRCNTTAPYPDCLAG